MIIKKATLETVCGITSKLPKHTLPEFAFAGKSNVGKSSFINALVNQKALARVSQEPGKTQTINYYLINNEAYFVDLPGYGFARVSKETQEKWGKMIEDYLHTSESLKAVFLLVDMRHEPSANDLQMAEWIQANGFDPIIILTKCDKLSKNEQAKMKSIHKKAFANFLGDEPILAFSSLTKQGKEEVLELMDNYLKM